MKKRLFAIVSVLVITLGSSVAVYAGPYGGGPPPPVEASIPIPPPAGSQYEPILPEPVILELSAVISDCKIND